jgi:hypothetical protein
MTGWSVAALLRHRREFPVTPSPSTRSGQVWQQFGGLVNRIQVGLEPKSDDLMILMILMTRPVAPFDTPPATQDKPFDTLRTSNCAAFSLGPARRFYEIVTKFL